MKKWMLLGVNLFMGTACCAGVVGASESDFMHEGFYLGLGGSYNSINLTQNSWGKGISTIITTTGVISNGVAEGTGAAFNDITNTLAPEIRVGYFKHIPNTQNSYGIKLSYQYLNTIATNPNLYIPQLGQTTSAVTGITSPLFGYVNADAVKVKSKHQFTLLGYIGESFGNKFVYVGVGPSLFNLRSRNIYSIGYAIVDGVTINVTGLVSYSSPSVWMVGATGQLGMKYFITPCWFLDGSYTYSITGNRRIPHQQGFANAETIGSVSYTTSGTIITKNTLRIKNQTLSLTINKVLDFL